MNFGFTDEQREIKDTARSLLWRRRAFEQARAGFQLALWEELRVLGWPGVAVGAEYGGGGLGIVELTILAEELGYALAAVPLLASAAAAAVIERAGSPEQRARWLPGLADGSFRGALGLDSESLVADAPEADVVVAVHEGAAWSSTRHSMSEASSASLRKVVILPPNTDRSGAPAPSSISRR